MERVERHLLNLLCSLGVTVKFVEASAKQHGGLRIQGLCQWWQ